MASGEKGITFTIGNDIEVQLDPMEKQEVLNRLREATTESLAPDAIISFNQLKEQAKLFLSSIMTLDRDYSLFTQATLNEIIISQPDATVYLNKTQISKERLYTQSLYMLAFQFDEYLSRFRKEDAERKALYVFEEYDKNGNVNLKSYEMSYKELVANADKHGRIGNISKIRLTSNDRKSKEEEGIIPQKHIDDAQIAYNAVNNRLKQYFKTHEGQKQNGIVMWKEGKTWMLGNVLNTGDLKEAYTSFLFDKHEQKLCKTIESNPSPGKDGYYSHNIIDLFYNNYIHKVSNLSAIVQEDVVTTDKQYGIKGKKAALPSLQQYVDVASSIISGGITEKEIEQQIKDKFNASADGEKGTRNMAVALKNANITLKNLTAKELRELFNSLKE